MLINNNKQIVLNNHLIIKNSNNYLCKIVKMKYKKNLKVYDDDVHIFFIIINITNPNITYLYNSLVFILNKSLNQL